NDSYLEGQESIGKIGDELFTIRLPRKNGYCVTIRGVPQLVQKLAVGGRGCPHDLQKLDPKAGAGINCALIIACFCLSFLATATAPIMTLSMAGMFSVISSGSLKTLAMMDWLMQRVCVVVEGIL